MSGLADELTKLQTRVGYPPEPDGEQESFQRTLAHTWDRLQTMDQNLQAWAAEGQRFAHDQQNQTLQALETLKTLIEQNRHSEQQDYGTLVSHLASVVKAFRGSFDRFDQSVEAAQSAMARELQHLEARMDHRQEVAVRDGISSLAPAVRELRSELLSGVEHTRAEILDRLTAIEHGAAPDVTDALKGRDQMREALEIVAQALKRLRERLEDSSEEQEARFMRELQAAEARSLKAMTQLRSQIIEEQRAGTIELQERMRMGIAEPLKGTVILLNDRVNDLQATMDRVLVHLRRIDQRVGGGGSRPPER